MRSEKRILLVEPSFPIPRKSLNHKNFLPIGLLKIASYLKSNGHQVQLVRGERAAEDRGFVPDEIWITSLFTYWSKYVRESVRYYRTLYQTAKVTVGGIYASLMPEHCKKYTGCDEVYIGVMNEAERFLPEFNLIDGLNSHPIDYQIIHTSRGCIRRCAFCGTWKIEPQFTAKKTIRSEIKYKRIVFYDNNLLANPNIESVLGELIELRQKKKILWCESQSGFDGRILLEKPHLGSLLKKAAFRYPRIAWDWTYEKHASVQEQLRILTASGYSLKDIFVFVLYNWKIPFEEMERKRVKCWKWGVQIADCRYRPLDQTFDSYHSHRRTQPAGEYYIHRSSGWTDASIRQFRRNIRRQNICVRHGFPFYSNHFEHKQTSRGVMRKVKSMETKKEKIGYLEQNHVSYWLPDTVSSMDTSNNGSTTKVSVSRVIPSVRWTKVELGTKDAQIGLH